MPDTCLISCALFVICALPLFAQRPVSIDNGKILQQEQKKLLWGEEDERVYFDITDCEVKDGSFSTAYDERGFLP